MKLIDWQFYWKKWGFSYTTNPYDGYDIQEYWVFIGPLQLRFWK